ncbi:MAG: glycosyltransferase [Methanosphaera sp.]|nr:glycosyltransferase [Methanosphaera sp.]
MAKISVLIPVYNVAKYLGNCLDSVINQTFKDIEIICINDGSTDNSLKILEEYARKDERIKIISQENQGLGASRNVAIENAKGDYIFFLDSDDLLFNQTLEKLYENITANKTDIVLCKLARFNKINELNYSIPCFDLESVLQNVDFMNYSFTYKDIKEYVLNNSFSACLKLYNRKFLLEEQFKFDTKIFFEDVLFHVKVILKAKKISYVPEFLYKYRLSNDTSIINKQSRPTDIFKVIDSVKNFLQENNCFNEFINEFTLFQIIQITNYLEINNAEYFKLSKRYLFKLRKTDSPFIDSFIPNKLVTIIDNIVNARSIEEYNNVILGYYNLINEDKFIVEKNQFQSESDLIYNENCYLKKHINLLEGRIVHLLTRIDSLEKNNKEFLLLKQENQKLEEICEQLIDEKDYLNKELNAKDKNLMVLLNQLKDNNSRYSAK